MIGNKSSNNSHKKYKSHNDFNKTIIFELRKLIVVAKTFIREPFDHNAEHLICQVNDVLEICEESAELSAIRYIEIIKYVCRIIKICMLLKEIERTAQLRLMELHAFWSKELEQIKLQRSC